MKNILIVSPTPTHPQFAGNSSRIFNFCEYLRSIDCNLHFLYLEKDPGDLEAMTLYWGDKLYHTKYNWKATTQRREPVEKYAGLSIDELKDIYNYDIDDWYDPQLDDLIANICQEVTFDTVIVEYVFLSKAFLNFDEKVKKILDTHDVFTNRCLHYLNSKQQPVFFSVSPEEESKALERADHVLAIQQKEKEHFESISNTPVAHIGHFLDLEKLEFSGDVSKILFLGSANSINVDAINFFIDEVIPILDSKKINFELVVAGRVCNKVSYQHQNVNFVGEIDDLKDLYQQIDVVINPRLIGTGLSIKSLEAMAYGKPLISSSAGATGLKGVQDKSFILADSASEYADAFLKLKNDHEVYREIADYAFSFVDKYQQDLKDAIKILID